MATAILQGESALSKSVDIFAMRWVEGMRALRQRVMIDPQGELTVGGRLHESDEEEYEYQTMIRQANVVAGAKAAIARYVRLYPDRIQNGWVVG